MVRDVLKCVQPTNEAIQEENRGEKHTGSPGVPLSYNNQLKRDGVPPAKYVKHLSAFFLLKLFWPAWTITGLWDLRRGVTVILGANGHRPGAPL